MRIAISLVAILTISCSFSSRPDPDAAARRISAESMLANIRTLSSDEFEGRAPGSPAEEKTVSWLADQFRQLGLESAVPGVPYFQRVPLVGITSSVTGSILASGRRIELNPLQDFVAVSRPQVETNSVTDSELVFVGYGVVAPEYNWDDYKGASLKGKTMVMLVNDPPTEDQSLFKGKAMTYYGRWTYKYEIASEKEAAAALIIHETGPAGYPFEVVTGSWGRENFDLEAQDGNRNRVPVEGWISREKAVELFKACGQDFEALKKAAATREFEPVPLNARASFTVRNQIRRVQSRNVAALLRGSDEARRSEFVVYTAHWDHLGRDSSRQGDQIFNGALDNASGVAGLLEIAKAFVALDPKPRRSILFLSTTAEEKGLLGARYYAQNPIFPLASTLAEINIDGVNQWGKTRDIVVVGQGNTTLEDTLVEAARAKGRTVTPDPEPEKGYYYRSDHFEFAKVGIPALYTDSGDQFIGKSEGYGKAKRDDYTNNDYHKVTDEVKPDWDLSGAVEDLRLLFDVGFRVAEADSIPQWKPGAEFKAVRDEMLNR